MATPWLEGETIVTDKTGNAKKDNAAQKRLGIIGIIINDRTESAPKVNSVLGDHAAMIVGRHGQPFRDRGINVIGLIIEGSTDEVGALTGKLGMLKGVKVKSFVI